MLGDVYRGIKRKDLLHLAVLLHDLGKGQEEDHSEVGKRLAEEVAARLGFDEQDTQDAHLPRASALLMAHTAFRRDPNDDEGRAPLCPRSGDAGSPEEAACV